MANRATQPSTDRSVVHAVFHLERTYTATPERVFKAFADPAVKAVWFAATPDKWQVVERVMDFKVAVANCSRANGPTAP